MLSLPPSIAEMLDESAYGDVLPSKLAKVVLSGVSEIKTATIPSSEFELYLTAASNALSELSNTLNTFVKLRVEAFTIPAGYVYIDISLPQKTISREMINVLAINRAFIEILDAFQQVINPAFDPPALVYSSTSDLVTGVTVAILAVKPIMEFYSKLLEIAKTHLELRQMVKTLKNSSLKLEEGNTLDEQVRQRTAGSIGNAVSESLKEVETIQDKGRLSELENKITIRSSVVLDAITNGARLNITIESLVTLKEQLEIADLKADPLFETLRQNQLLAIDVEKKLKDLSEEIPFLIETRHASPRN